MNKQKKERVKMLMEDWGFSRKEAIEWIKIMET